MLEMTTPVYFQILFEKIQFLAKFSLNKFYVVASAIEKKPTGRWQPYILPNLPIKIKIFARSKKKHPKMENVNTMLNHKGLSWDFPGCEGYCYSLR